MPKCIYKCWIVFDLKSTKLLMARTCQEALTLMEQDFQVTIIAFGPCREKTCLRGFWPGYDTNWAVQPQKVARGLKFPDLTCRGILLSL